MRLGRFLLGAATGGLSEGVRAAARKRKTRKIKPRKPRGAVALGHMRKAKSYHARAKGHVKRARGAKALLDSLPQRGYVAHQKYMAMKAKQKK